MSYDRDQAWAVFKDQRIQEYNRRRVMEEENQRRARFGERKLHIDCSFKTQYSETLSKLLESKGYRYGHSGREYERRAELVEGQQSFVTEDYISD